MRLPQGKRQDQLMDRFNKFLKISFVDRIFTFDHASALPFGKVCKARELEGLDVDSVDMMIAAIASQRGMTIATRNTKDFEHSGVKLINPFDYRL